jgi:hypothetical protein
VANAGNEYDQGLIPQLAHDSIIANTISPQAGEPVPQRSSEQASAIRRRNPGFEELDDFPSDFVTESVQVVDRAWIVFNPPGQGPGAPERWSGVAWDC